MIGAEASKATHLKNGKSLVQARTCSNARSFPDQIWQDSLVEPEDVRLQQNSDGSYKQLGNGSFGKVSLLWELSFRLPACFVLLGMLVIVAEK